MSVLEEVDFDSLEKQFAGGGNFNGGFDDGNGDDDDGEPGDGNYNYGPGYTEAGAAVGLGFGVALGGVGLFEADRIMLRNYAANHHVAVPTRFPAVKRMEAKAINNHIEIGAFMGPIILAAALGTVVGNRLKRRRH